ncbi:hypothetical protein SEPCBS119000_001679 [Sporothrix epigloea]|uniref:DUF8004 domain-containing protein n=1 Tax=Sporothrix epigloea TaxID=1892477 RepID=A0ABP0DF42_9PEZI
MSGRSAYVRKKITETNEFDAAVTRGRAHSSASSEDKTSLSDYNTYMRQVTGIGTTNGRLLKFSEPIREIEPLDLGSDHPSIASTKGNSVHSRRYAGQRPLDDFAYAHARRPNVQTEDISGIQRSGIRSAVDKKSEGVRRGLAKAFAFGKKNKNRDEEIDDDSRSQSSNNVRTLMGRYADEGYHNAPVDPFDMPRTAGSLHQQMLQLQEQQRMLQECYRQELPPQVSVNRQEDWILGHSASPPPSSKLPPIPPSSNAPHIKRWVGAGRPVQRWNKLRKDPELWDPNGDVLVFFGQKGRQPRPNPSFRLSSHIIEATESRYLIKLLREGSTEEDVNLPPSPIDATLGPYTHGHEAYRRREYGVDQLTPPVSEDASLVDSDGQISYEIYFPAPSNMNKADRLRFHLATRNVFALLYNASLVGLSLYQALVDLHAQLVTILPPDIDSVEQIISYLRARGIDDVRNDAEAAVSLLAWSEGPKVRWEEGWRESFVHSTGMYTSLEGCADFKNVTLITRALLERAYLETHLRVQAAEERLADFQFADMWPATLAKAASNPSKAAAERLQRFFSSHYTHVYGRWPPLPPARTEVSKGGLAGDAEDDIWLTRTVAYALQRDFAALYDYLVDRDIVWDGSETRPGRKWMLVSESGNKAFEADAPDLPMTDMLVEFDNKLRYPHIPHPYPLVPDSIPPNSSTQASGKAKDNKASATTSGGKVGSLERRVQLAYTMATNMLILGSDFHHADLIDAFSKFEKNDRVGDVDPSTARRGRWVLIYGILQTLASVSVDVPNMRYHDGVSYHLSPRLNGAKLPPWQAKGGGSGLSDEAAQELSHCWTVPRTWNTGNDGALTGCDENPIASCDGSGRQSFERRGSIIIGYNGSHGAASGGHNFSKAAPNKNLLAVRSNSVMSFHTSKNGQPAHSSARINAFRSALRDQAPTLDKAGADQPVVSAEGGGADTRRL